MNKISNWLWGIVLIVIGGIWAVNVLGIYHIDVFFPGWWTLFIIVPCFINLFSKDESKLWNLVGLVVGGCLLLGCLGVFDLAMVWKLFAPAVLVVIGLSFILKDTVKSQMMKKAKVLDDDAKEYCATLNDIKVDFDGEKFEGAKLEAVFGAVRCDLRGAKIEDGAMIKASSIFGGVKIFVPDEVEVKMTSASVFGGATNKQSGKRGESKKNKTAKTTLYIDATCVFGGVEVRS